MESSEPKTWYECPNTGVRIAIDQDADVIMSVNEEWPYVLYPIPLGLIFRALEREEYEAK